MMRNLSAGVCALVLMLCLTGRVHAVLLLPGTSLFPVPGEVGPTGTLIAHVSAQFTSPLGSGPFTGTLATSVFAGDATNPFGLGGLTFTFTLTNDATSLTPLSGLMNFGFAGVQTDASYEIPPTGILPFRVDRGGGLAVGDIHWDFTIGGGPGVLTPGTSSAVLVIQTDTTVFTANNFASVIGSTVPVPSFGPAVPEPSALGIGIVGAMMLGGRRKVRRRTCTGKSEVVPRVKASGRNVAPHDQ